MEKLRANILLVDDEADSMEQSRGMISLYAEEGGIYTAANSVEVMQVLQSVPIDLAFVDIEMPDSDGFTIAGYIQSVQPKAKYVFLTGHTELGARSYDYEPLDFLCKPVNALRLQRTFQRFRRASAQSGAGIEQVAIESASGFVLISPADILYVTRESRKTAVCCQGASYTVKNSLDELELIFSEYGLFRCHQSYLVSLRHVTGVAQSDFGRTYWAVLDGGQRIPVSRGKYGPMQIRMQQRGVQFV